jgi:ArsR family transcriptional regulator
VTQVTVRPSAAAPRRGRGSERAATPGLVERTCELQAALGIPVRMKMIKVLGSHQQAPLSVTEVARTLRISQPTATKHLRILHEAGFVNREQAASRVYYTLNLGTIAEYRRLLSLAFAHATTRCVNAFDCETCTFAATCA